MFVRLGSYNRNSLIPSVGRLLLEELLASPLDPPVLPTVPCVYLLPVLRVVSYAL